MISRNIEPFVLKYAREYPVIAVVGPRQSGKTTLAQKLFPNHSYVTLESLDNRQRAISDPRQFLRDIGPNAILDEIQRTPDLFSYLQEIVDNDPTPGKFVLTGSHQFLSMERISQTLAGRIVTFRLFPFTINELYHLSADRTESDVFQPKTPTKMPAMETDEIMFTGLYPRIHDQKLTPTRWYDGYLETYIERDVRQIIKIGDLSTFETFLMIAATMSGQELNYASVSSRVGISQPTVKSWLSILEASGIAFRLLPYYRNFAKRLVKTPKLYFTDTGLLCFLLKIRSVDHLKHNPLYGSIFETLIVSEFFKRIHHIGERPDLHFWRDRSGDEIDLIAGDIPIEIKSAATWKPGFSTNIDRWLRLAGNPIEKGYILYQGTEVIASGEAVEIYPWFAMYQSHG